MANVMQRLDSMQWKTKPRTGVWVQGVRRNDEAAAPGARLAKLDVLSGACGRCTTKRPAAMQS